MPVKTTCIYVEIHFGLIVQLVSNDRSVTRTQRQLKAQAIVGRVAPPVFNKNPSKPWVFFMSNRCQDISMTSTERLLIMV